MNIINLTNQIRTLSQRLTQTTDPDEREELEAELEELNDQLADLQDEESERYGWS